MKLVFKQKDRQDTMQGEVPDGAEGYGAALAAGYEWARYTGGGPVRIYEANGTPLGVVTATLVETEEEMEELGA